LIEAGAVAYSGALNNRSASSSTQSLASMQMAQSKPIIRDDDEFDAAFDRITELIEADRESEEFSEMVALMQATKDYSRFLRSTQPADGQRIH
jgi:prephenate dehydrogenase